MTENKSGYMPQLDTLRAISIIMVLFGHWITKNPVVNFLPLGPSGVTFFFVLSGFLISGILMKSRDDADSLGHSLFHSLRQFYIRRTLRIFPIYYFLLAILFALNIENIRSIFLWFFFYFSNYYFYMIQDWAGPLSHLWTLAIEEQFYLFWPFIILFIPKRHLLNVIYIFICTGIIYRGFNFATNVKTETHIMFSYVLTLSNIDAFGLGAWLAYVRRFSDKTFNFFSGKYLFFFFGSIFFVVFIMKFQINIFDVALYKFCIALIGIFLVSKFSLGVKGKLKFIFENRAIIYIGKISYGMYLYHTFVPLIYQYFKLPYFDSEFIMFTIYFSILLLVSSISWFILEKPINNLKKKFSYT